MDYTREISTYIEEKAFVTVNWLSQELQVSVKKAIELVQEFKSNKSDSVASYRIAYRDEVGGVQVTTVNDSELEQLQQLPYEILSKQIYSISKINSAISQSMILDAALSQAEELLKTTSATHGSFLSNSSGEIHLSDVEIKSFGDRIFSAQNILFKAPSVSFSQTASLPPVPSIVKVPSMTTSNKENKPAPVSTATAAPTTQSATLKKISKTNEDAAKKFFGAFVGAPKPLDLVLEDRCADGAGDDEEEWDDGKVKLAVRQPVIKKLASDEVVDFSSQETDVEKNKMDVVEEDSQDGTANKKRKAAKVNVLTRGAMDDYMEDVAIEEHKRKQQDEASGEPPLKKKKRVLVEKSFMDSDGYFVTEMVWDEVTDDESETPATAHNKAVVDKMAPNSSTTKENNPTNEMKREASQGNKQPLKPKTQAKPSAPAGTGQKSMMSFFGKKA